jgi:SAM-dependent methyltransferase
MSRLTKLRALKWPTIGYEVQKNLRSRTRERRGGLRAITAVGASLPAPAARVVHSRNAFESFLASGELEREGLAGTRVLELGPGEDLSVAIRFLAAGAAAVSCIDRFEFQVDEEWRRSVYRLLLDDLDEEGRRRVSDVLTAEGRLVAEESRLRLITGVGIEEGAGKLAAGTFDLIVSVAVLEHVYDLEASFRAMDALLAPGGTMVHQVDLRDHGMFSGGGRHPLEFLTIADPLYRLMTSHTGAPNRDRIGTYRELLAELGHQATIKVTNVGGAPEDIVPYREHVEPEPALAGSIEDLRPRLQGRFASLPVEELAATGIVIRSRKAGGPGEPRQPGGPH